jgi:hypothetical protein
LEPTEIRPSIPAWIERAAVPSSPLSTANCGLRRASSACTRPVSPTASLMPTMLGWLASSATVSGCMSQPVRPGTLYSTTGSPPWSATAR